MVVDADGTEHHRLEGFLPKTEFLSQLALGLARAAFDHGRWEEAEAAFDQVLQDYPDTEAAPEALYWRGVTRYKASGEAADLTATAEEFQRRYTDTPWARKASVWAG